MNITKDYKEERKEKEKYNANFIDDNFAKKGYKKALQISMKFLLQMASYIENIENFRLIFCIC